MVIENVKAVFVSMEVTDLDKLQLMKNELTPCCCFGCQHMDGSYCVKPLKQKQVVSAAAFFSAFLPPFMTTFLIPSNTKTHQSLIVKLLPPETYFLCCSPVSSLSLQVDGVSYLLQEIYGIENKYNSQESKVRTSEEEFFGGSCLPPSQKT